MRGVLVRRGPLEGQGGGGRVWRSTARRLDARGGSGERRSFGAGAYWGGEYLDSGFSNSYLLSGPSGQVSGFSWGWVSAGRG